MQSVYAQLVILSMKDHSAIPKALQKYTVRNGYHYSVQLRGSQSITAEKGTIAYLVRHNEITNLYISPLKADPVGTEEIQPFRSLYARFPSGWKPYHFSFSRFTHDVDPHAAHLEVSIWNSFSTVPHRT